MFHDLPRQMRISLLKQLLDNSVKHKIHQIVCITSNNGKPEYRERTYAKNDVILKPGWISDAFELSEPEFYKIVTTVECDDDSKNIYTVPIVQCNLQTSADEYKYEEIHHNTLICPGGSISKKEPSKISEKKKICLYIVPDEPTLFYQQGNHNSCLISSLASALHYMGNEYSSKYISSSLSKNLFWKFIIKVGYTSAVIFLWYITERKTKKG